MKTAFPARVGPHYVVPVPADAGDFYVSGTGHLCARHPRPQILLERPVSEFGIRFPSQIVGLADLEACRAAGISGVAGVVGLLLSPELPAGTRAELDQIMPRLRESATPYDRACLRLLTVVQDGQSISAEALRDILADLDASAVPFDAARAALRSLLGNGSSR